MAEASAIVRRRRRAPRTATLRASLDRMAAVGAEKDRLLDRTRALVEELHHRVRNTLQLIYGMLVEQLKDTESLESRRGLEAIARRVSSLARVYDHLLGAETTGTTDFGSYVTSLCLDLEEIRGTSASTGSLSCDSDPLLLDLDTVTALGLVVTELVANSFDHARPDGGGASSVTVRASSDGSATATLTVRDDGPGFAGSVECKRHGLGLMRRLVEQVRGSAQMTFDQGTVWTIRFPVPSVIAAAPPPAPRRLGV